MNARFLLLLMLSANNTIQNTVTTSSTAKRIISLVPSQTELLYDLGLNEEVVGITKFCIHPNKWFRTKTRIGGTKTADIEKIKALQPDLIIANKEENIKEQVKALSAIAPVYTSDILSLDGALKMIEQVGYLVGKQEKALQLVSGIEQGFSELKSFIEELEPTELTAAYLIWKDPYMAAGGDTFINNMMEQCGFINIFNHLTRYPEIHIEQDGIIAVTPPSSNQSTTISNQQPSDQKHSVNHQPNCLLLSSEPYPFRQKHVEELQLKLPGTKIVLVDGEMFSWYGSRLLKAPLYFRKLIEQIQSYSSNLV